MPKPGTTLHRFLAWYVDVRPQPGCPCHAHRAAMDELGWLGCLREWHKVLGWLVEGANHLGYWRVTPTFMALTGVLCIERAKYVQRRGMERAGKQADEGGKR